MRVLSGIQPSGRLHLGNFFSMMKQMIHHQNSSELFCFIANLHALTTIEDGERMRQNTLDAAMDFLALGLDPERSVFWVQSDVPEVLELAWYLSNSAPVGLLERSHSYKDKLAKGIPANTGLFYYPVLMAADILLYQSHIVPVGKDQKQHVEITRDIAIKFNNTFGETFVIPDSLIEETTAVIPGIDGQKMSKSYGNTIDIFDDHAAIKKKVMSIVTDAKSVEEPKDPAQCNLFAIYKLFLKPEEIRQLEERYRIGGLKYSQVKKELVEVIYSFFEPYRQKREELTRNPDQVRSILKQGAEKARRIALVTLDEVRQKVGTRY
ncbi:MAG: tryptophan--tRNA ligase [Candidatus Delongbacteria bacterium]|nr:tryptophan--tRNA ligase [Candidatus Delongbacteria bacterium]